MYSPAKHFLLEAIPNLIWFENGPFALGRRQTKAALASAKADLSSLPEPKKLIFNRKAGFGMTSSIYRQMSHPAISWQEELHKNIAIEYSIAFFEKVVNDLNASYVV